MTEIDKGTVAKRSVHSVFYLISRQFFLNIISFVAFLVVTSVLAPREIGIYTAIIAVQRIISFFTDFGFGAALIQKKGEVSQKDITTTFTLQAGVTLSIFLIVLLLQDYILTLFDLAEGGRFLLLVLVFSIFLSSFKTIPSVLLERGINFGKLIIPQIIESLAFNITLVVLVLKGYGINSFAWAFLFSSLIGIPFYYFISPWKVAVGIYRESLKHLKFGLQFQAKNILATIKDDFLTALLPRFLSFAEIGYIGFAQRFAFFIYRYVVDSLTKVTFSAYARMQDDKTFLQKAIEKSLFFVSSSMFPILVGLMIVMPYAIDVYPNWSGKWEPAVISVVFFTLNALVSSLSGVLINVLDATGRVATTLRLMGLWTLLTWILVPVAILFLGYNGVSIASFIITLTIVYTVYLVKKQVTFSVMRPIIKPVFATFAMGITAYLVAPILVRDIPTLIVLIGGAGIIYGLALFVLAGKEIQTDLRKFVLNRR